jgi:hypothetical protein
MLARRLNARQTKGEGAPALRMRLPRIGRHAPPSRRHRRTGHDALAASLASSTDTRTDSSMMLRSSFTTLTLLMVVPPAPVSPLPCKTEPASPSWPAKNLRRAPAQHGSRVIEAP